jgi:hypothetical protein
VIAAFYCHLYHPLASRSRCAQYQYVLMFHRRCPPFFTFLYHTVIFLYICLFSTVWLKNEAKAHPSSTLPVTGRSVNDLDTKCNVDGYPNTYLPQYLFASFILIGIKFGAGAQITIPGKPVGDMPRHAWQCSSVHCAKTIFIYLPYFIAIKYLV